MSDDVARPDSVPAPGVVDAFDAGWESHRVGLSRGTVEAIARPSAKEWAVMAWDVRQTIVSRQSTNEEVRMEAATPTKVNTIKLVYDGWFDVVTVDGVKLDPKDSQAVFNHSPDGFSWGYGGSGPAQTALAILMHVTGDNDLSVRLHQQFKDDHVSQWPVDRGGEFHVDVAKWVELHRPEDDS